MLLLNSFKYQPFLSPDGEGSGDTEVIVQQPTIDALLEDDDKEPALDLKEEKIDEKEEKNEEGKEEKEEIIDELDELEKELAPPDEDELELVAPFSRKAILKDFPDLFKKYPHLEKAYYKAQQFTEVFPSVKDAKEAVEKADVLDKFDADIRRGDIANALKASKNYGEESFNNLVDNYLPNLYNVDKDAYHHVVGNIVRMTVNGMLNDAKGSNNAELQEAALILNRYVFATDKVNQPTKLSRENPNREEESRVALKERQLLQREFETVRDNLTTKVTNALKSTIEANIDPKESMTEYVRKNASRECFENLEEMLGADKRLGTLIDKLWEQAFKNNLSKTYVDKIRTAYVSRAKSLLPSALKKARNEALKGMGKRIKDEENEEPRRGPLPAGRSASSPNSGKTPSEKAKQIPVGMTSHEYLMQD